MNAIFSLSLFGFAQTLMLCMGLWFSTKKREAADCLFIAFLMIVCLIFLQTLLASSGVMIDKPEYIGWGIWVIFMAPPLVYFYMQFALCPDYQFPESAWVHFIPAMLGVVGTVVMFTVDPGIKKDVVQILQTEPGLLYSSHVSLFWVFHAEQILMLAQILLYWWISGGILNREKLDETQSEANRALVKWMRVVRHSILAFVLCSALLYLIDVFVTPVPMSIMLGIKHSILILIVISTFWYSLKGVTLSIAPSLSQDTLNEQAIKEHTSPSNIILSVSSTEENIAAMESTSQQKISEKNNTKYVKSKLSQQRIKQIVEQFEAVMLKGKYFVNDALSLSDVSNYLECSSNHLSQAINTVYEKSFTDLISDMRVEEAKRLLSMSADNTVLDICMMAGFKSKSGFYKSFRKCTGLTPTAYRKSLSLLSC